MFIFGGFCLFTAGAAKLPAPELILLSLLEVVGGIFFTYLVFGEVPGPLGLAGAGLIIVSVIFNGLSNECTQKFKGAGVKGGEGDDSDGPEASVYL